MQFLFANCIDVNVFIQNVFFCYKVLQAFYLYVLNLGSAYVLNLGSAYHVIHFVQEDVELHAFVNLPIK